MGRQVVVVVALAAVMVLGGVGILNAIAPPAAREAAAASPVAPSVAAAPQPSATPDARATAASGACGAGQPSASAAPAPAAGEPSASHPSALFNSQVEPYAVLTGPYGYVAAGAALRDQGYGRIALTWPNASRSSLVAAYLTWAIIDDSTPPSYGTINGHYVTGTWTAYATPSPCWSPTYIYTFMADVTPYVVNGTNTLTGFPSGVTNGSSPWVASQDTPMDEGASLIAIYETGAPSIHEVTVYTGALTSGGETISAQLNYTTTVSSSAQTTYIMEDGQLPGNGAGWNGVNIDSNAFPGSDPKETTIPWSEGNLSDTKTFNVTVAVGSNNSTAAMIGSGEDCLTWVGQVLSVQVAASRPPYSVVFQEQGLPNGTSWGVTSNDELEQGTVADGTSAVDFSLGNGSYDFVVSPVANFTATPSAGAYAVAGGSLFIHILFHPPVYPVVFNETGLGASTAWSVTLSNSSQDLYVAASAETPTAQIVFVEGNGNYTFSVGVPYLYTALPQSGIVTVADRNGSVNITFVPPPLFNVTFAEHGLPAGTSWGGRLFTEWGDFDNSTTNASFSVLLPNTTFADTIYPTDVPGYSVPDAVDFQVEGVAETIDVNYSELYPVNFTEVGLPAGTYWYVNLTGTSSTVSNFSETPLLGFSTPNGSYTFSVTHLWGYIATPASGPLTVDGKNVSVAIVFTVAPDYSLTFIEEGLPTGTSWSIDLLLPDEDTSTLSSTTDSIAYSEPNGSYTFTILTVTGYAATPSYGYPEIHGADVVEEVNFTQVFSVTFRESGLPSGTYWDVELNDTYSDSGTPSIVFSVTNGTLPFTVYPAYDGYFTATPSSGSVTVDGENVTELITYASTEYPAFPVTFTETGLPAGTNWSVVLEYYTEATTGTSLGFTEINGSFYFTVGTVAGYSATPGSGDLTVAGVTTQMITFVSTTATYAVTFTESGLPSGTEWWVNITGETPLSSTGTTVSTALSNASYDYSVASANKSYSSTGGSFTVDGAPVPVAVAFTLVTFVVTFTETGLPSGTEWWVNITGETPLSSTGTTVSTSLPNATYPYKVATVDKSYSSPGSSFPVEGSPVSVDVPFTLITFAVTFTETGLPLGTEWWVNITGETPLSSKGSTISLVLPNGTYSFIATSGNRSYTAPDSSTSVHGAPDSVTVPFGTGGSAGSAFLGLPGFDGYLLLGAAFFAAFLLLLLLAMRRRKKKEAGTGTQPGTGPGGGPPPPPNAP